MTSSAFRIHEVDIFSARVSEWLCNARALIAVLALLLGCGGTNNETPAYAIPPNDPPADPPGDPPQSCTDLQGTVGAGVGNCNSQNDCTLAKGIFCVKGDVIIPAGFRLIVSAGAELVFMDKYHFGKDPALDEGVASGGLKAIGTATEPIIFRAVDADHTWWGILIDSSAYPVELTHVIIRDGYKNDLTPTQRQYTRGGGLGSYQNFQGTYIHNCKFISNKALSVAGALDINSNEHGRVEIWDTLFNDNSCECGYVDNEWDYCGGGAIRLSHINDTSSFSMERNQFLGNLALYTQWMEGRGGAINGFDNQVNIGEGNVFRGNYASSLDGAISCAYSPGGPQYLGVNFISVDQSNAFEDNTPDIGCGCSLDSGSLVCPPGP